jgi:hypothetical protein
MPLAPETLNLWMRRRHWIASIQQSKLPLVNLEATISPFHLERLLNLKLHVPVSSFQNWHSHGVVVTQGPSNLKLALAMGSIPVGCKFLLHYFVHPYVLPVELLRSLRRAVPSFVSSQVYLLYIFFRRTNIRKEQFSNSCF